MDIEIDLTKSLHENASDYYERAKKIKKKLEGLEAAIEKTKMEIKIAEQKAIEAEKKAVPVKKSARKKDWYEKFRWFVSSDGFLVVGGRDLKSNEHLVRTYMKDDDYFLHADIQGGSATVIVTEGKEVPPSTLAQAASFAASNSKAFSLGLRSCAVYCLKGSQISLAAPTGEFLAKGSFAMKGKREWFRSARVETTIGWDDERGRVVSGPADAIPVVNKITVIPGKHKKGEIAKLIKAKLKLDCDIEEIISMLPPGNCEVGGK